MTDKRIKMEYSIKIGGKMMKSVYNEQFRWNDDALNLTKKIESSITDIIKDALVDGFSPESVFYIGMDVISTTILEYILFEKSREEKKV